MQTFLPFADFAKSAKVLDYRRLGKQRVEILQLLNGLLLKTEKQGWKNHPCSLMWKGYEGALIKYGVTICDEWVSRGYKDTCKDKILYFKQFITNDDIPSWIGSQPFHLSHQSNLLRKDAEYYRQYFPSVRADIPYIWPVQFNK